MTEIELPQSLRNEWLKRIRKARGASQKSLSAETGLAQNMISMLESGDRALSRKSAERLAEELDVCPVALYVSSKVDSVVKAIENETSLDGHELSKLVRLRSKLAALSVNDELPDNEELDAAVDHLLETIKALEDDEPPIQSKKSRELDDEEEDNGRDLFGRRVDTEDFAPVSRDLYGKPERREASKVGDVKDAGEPERDLYGRRIRD